MATIQDQEIRETVGNDRPTFGRRWAGLWGSAIVVGIGLFILGWLAIGASFAAGLAAMAVLGTLLIVGGVAEVISGFAVGRATGFWVPVLAGVLSAIIGVALVRNPGSGLGAATILVGAYLVASGLFRTITSVADRYAHWGWDLFYGVVSIGLGGYLFATYPVSALWIVGTLVGIELMMRGIAWVGAGFTARRLLRA